MFVDDLFGPASVANTPDPRFSLDGSDLEVYISPEDGTSARLIELIGGARKEIQFMAYSFTSDEIAAAMIERAKAGVMIAGVMDESQVHPIQGQSSNTCNLPVLRCGWTETLTKCIIKSS